MNAGALGPASSHSKLQVGEWQVDSSLNQLARHGSIVRVEPKVMEVLLLLAWRAGQAVSREELLATVWPGVIVGLAQTHAADYRNQWTANRAQALARAGEFAKTAFEIDPELPEVYWVLAYVHAQRREHEQALAHLKQALALDRSFADAYALLGGVYTYMGQPANSVPALRSALRLNPGAGYLYYLLLGRAYLFLGDAEQAAINLREALSRNATNLEARVYLAAALSLAGHRDAAQWEAEEIRSLAPDFSMGKWLETYPMTDAGQKQRLTDLAAAAGLN